MTKVNISYHRENLALGKCDIELPKEMVEELLDKFQRLFSEELKLASFKPIGSNMLISFFASREKIQILEGIMIAVKNMVARLN